MNLRIRKKNIFSGFLNTDMKQNILYCALAIIISLSFIMIGFINYSPGFPLDDSWIHQTFARNFASSGQWIFSNNIESAGSTSPLWTLLLSIGPLLGIKTPYFWTFFLSIGFFTGLIFFSLQTIRNLNFRNNELIFFFSITMICEWHLLWSVSSGMETIYFCFMIIYLFYQLSKDKFNLLLLGLLLGLIIWIRPDGITLLGPMIVMMFYKILHKELNWRKIYLFIIPFIVCVILYAFMNYDLSGKIFPNTYYAKQLEYASLLNISLLSRLMKILSVPINGIGIILLPGFIIYMYQAFKQSHIWKITAFLWIIGYCLIYAIQLPLIYQHGRYIIPVIPIYILLGVLGTYETIKIFKEQFSKLIFRKIYLPILVLCMLLIDIKAEKIYIEDLKAIDQLMVKPASWIKENTNENDVIAVHDIGAMGYFSNRNIIDLAGLVQPEIIPIINDENALIEYINQTNVSYIVTFSDWYSEINEVGKVVETFIYQSNDFSQVVQINMVEKK